MAIPIAASSCLLLACQQTPGTTEIEAFPAPRDEMPAYYDFVQSLQARGFTFMDFGTFWRADKDSLPEQLVVIRHDVHHRDVAPAYRMRDVEAALLPAGSATYFVMLGFPPEAAEAAVQQDYLDLILRLKSESVDVQPHVSPDDMYVSAYRPPWKNKSARKLLAFTDGDYAIDTYDDGVEIVPVGNDVLDIKDMNERLVSLLGKYNQQWTRLTGLPVGYYAAHGSHVALNKVLNNGTILDQRELIAAGVYEFDVYNTRVHRYLADLSDNSQPDWMDHPETIAPGRYQLLAHPHEWDASMTSHRRALEAEEKTTDDALEPETATGSLE